jgi:hypothetical protein
MKFMDKVVTPAGVGLVVGQGEEGTVLVSIARQDLVRGSCSGPCVNVWVRMDQVQGPVVTVRVGVKGGGRGWR